MAELTVIVQWDLVSMGAVVALAPMVYESEGARTHGFWLFFVLIPPIFIKRIGKILRM